jgi:uncharacterized protein (DUF4415 family)
MRANYDFSKAKKSPYPKLLKKKQVTLRLDDTVLTYFKDLGLKKQLPWQTLVNLYLRNCAEEKKELRIVWQSATK